MTTKYNFKRSYRKYVYDTTAVNNLTLLV